MFIVPYLIPAAAWVMTIIKVEMVRPPDNEHGADCICQGKLKIVSELPRERPDSCPQGRLAQSFVWNFFDMTLNFNIVCRLL